MHVRVSAFLLLNLSLGDSLGAGEVGFVIAGIKDLESTKVGDTITLSKNKADEALPGLKKSNLKFLLVYIQSNRINLML